MSIEEDKQKQRQRAPSQRALESRARILDAAERVFARGGFDAATMRDIAAEAGVPVGLVSHHGGTKEALFAEVVARRADELSTARLQALAEVQAATEPGAGADAAALLRAFIGPYVARAEAGGAQWLAYARLVAMVSSDPRWQGLAQQHFDPTARRFVVELGRVYPQAEPAAVAECYVYAISAMLALLTSRWRIAALSGGQEGGDLEGLIAFCAAGVAARLGGVQR
ncbi:MAG: TetR/AcrR family transcriptional regulator [Paracoccaceae bacterium]|nr:TetR/AcrR family transcriptional regulator [Paracoccaceae bacterium]